jgi:hypothetical protein
MSSAAAVFERAKIANVVSSPLPTADTPRTVRKLLHHLLPIGEWASEICDFFADRHKDLVLARRESDYPELPVAIIASDDSDGAPVKRGGASSLITP